MDRRVEAISKLEELRGNRILTYVTGDRQPFGARIGEDAVRPFFDVLSSIGSVDKLDLFIYSRGGAIEVPWRIASALRQYAQNWNVLIPFRANSAATLLALGADEIVLGRHGELGPIDPILNLQHTPGRPGVPDGTLVAEDINVEDVMAYLRFVREQVGLSDQAALSTSFGRLVERLDATVLGSVYRTRSHIRDVAHRMLTSQQEPPSERAMETIVETLAARVYAHGHAVGFTEADDIGLKVVRPSDEVDRAMWNLLCIYEEDLKLREPLDVEACATNGDVYEEQASIAVVESAQALYECRGTITLRPVRQMPPTLNVTVNLNPQLPPGIPPESIPDELSAMLQQLVSQITPAAQQAVVEALKHQATVIRHEGGFRGAKWEQLRPSDPPNADDYDGENPAA